jgi:hypothetical protein
MFSLRKNQKRATKRGELFIISGSTNQHRKPVAGFLLRRNGIMPENMAPERIADAPLGLLNQIS